MTELTVYSSVPIAGQYRERLLKGNFLEPDTWDLLPENTCRSIITEIEEQLKPASKKTVIEAAQFLVGSFPATQLKQHEIYSKSLIAAISDYPADILRIGFMEIIKTEQWIPSIATVVKHMDKLKSTRLALSMRAERQLMHHERIKK